MAKDGFVCELVSWRISIFWWSRMVFSHSVRLRDAPKPMVCFFEGQLSGPRRILKEGECGN